MYGIYANIWLMIEDWRWYMGVSENSVPDCTQWFLLIIIPFLNGYFIGSIPNIFRQTQMKEVWLKHLTIAYMLNGILPFKY